MGDVDLSVVCERAFSEMKDLVLENSKSKNFPQTKFGVRKDDLGKVDCPVEESSWEIGTYGCTGYGGKIFLAKKPGIIVDVLPKKYLRDSALFVVLSADGIYRFDRLEGNIDGYADTRRFPELTSQKEEMVDYCVYGQKALTLLNYFNSLIEVLESEVKEGYFSQEGCLREKGLTHNLFRDLSRLETHFNHHAPVDLDYLISLDATNSAVVAS